MDTGTALVIGSGLLATVLAILIKVLGPLAQEYAQKIRDERIRALVIALIQEAEKQFGGGTGVRKLAYVQVATKRITGHEPSRALVEEALAEVKGAGCIGTAAKFSMN